MKYKLSDFAHIIPGYAFRKAIEPNTNGNINVFQARDIIQGESLRDTISLVRTSFNVPEYSNHLLPNDILLVARGMKAGLFRSMVFTSKNTNVVASSSVHIIRMKKSGILPEYVSCYLNSPEGQENLSHIVSGSYIGALSRRKLETIEIPIPPHDTQQAIINLQRNIQEQRKLLNRKVELEENIVNATFKRITTHELL